MPVASPPQEAESSWFRVDIYVHSLTAFFHDHNQ